jgi:hypothetical protein
MTRHTNFYDRQNSYNNYTNNEAVIENLSGLQNYFNSGINSTYINKSVLANRLNTPLVKERVKNTDYINHFLVVKEPLRIYENTPLEKERTSNKDYANNFLVIKDKLQLSKDTPILQNQYKNINYANIYPNKGFKVGMIRVSSFGKKLEKNNNYYFKNTIYSPILSKDFFKQKQQDLENKINLEDKLWKNRRLNKKSFSFGHNNFNEKPLSGEDENWQNRKLIKKSLSFSNKNEAPRC